MIQTIHSDYEELSLKAYRVLIDRMKSVVKEKGSATVAFCGGRSVLGLYQHCADSEEPVWSKAKIFLIDERVVPITSEDSNFKLVMDTFARRLIDKNLLSKEQLYPFELDAKAADHGASKYYELLKKQGECFDIILLSAGEDGHIAALFPKDEALAMSGYHYLDDSPKAPPKRITATPSLIAKAAFILLFFTSNAKKGAYTMFKSTEYDEEDCPAKIAKRAGELIIFTDLKD